MRERYRKHQLVGVKVEVEIEVDVKTDRTNQPIEPTIDQPIELPTDRSRAQLPGKPDKQLLGEAEDNRERLCKAANGQDNLHEQIIENH